MSEHTAHDLSRDDSNAYACPRCGTGVDAPDDGVTNLLQCPTCGEQFFRPAAGQETNEDGYDGDPPDREDELDGRRITRHSTLKRALYRSQSYATVFAVAFGLLHGHTLWLFTSEVLASGVTWWAAVYVILGGGSGWIALHAFRRTIVLNAEARRMSLSEPDVPPDFSTLGDGSQAARRFDDMKW